MQGFAWLQWFAIIAGLLVCVRHRYLAPAMPLVILGFLGLAAQFAFNLSFSLLQSLTGATGIEWFAPAFAVSGLVGLASWILLVVGLALVGKHLRDRIQYLREIHDEREGIPGEGAG